MATDINTVVIVGRLTRDAELTYANSGAAICKFAIANNYSRKQADSWTEETSFFDAVLIGRRAEALHRYLVKGKQVAVQGELRQNRWETDGQKRSRVEIMVNDLNLLGGGSGSQGAGSGQASAGPGGGPGSAGPGGRDAAAGGAQGRPKDDDYGASDFEDDVPF